MTASLIICSNRGTCTDGVCKCNEGYSGALCEWYQCPTGQTFVNNLCVHEECVTSYDDVAQTTSVCGGYGRCVEDDGSYKCSCRSDAKVIDGECVNESCITNSATNEVCSGHGKCNGYNCVCSVGYFGKHCNVKHFSELYFVEDLLCPLSPSVIGFQRCVLAELRVMLAA